MNRGGLTLAAEHRQNFLFAACAAAFTSNHSCPVGWYCFHFICGKTVLKYQFERQDRWWGPEHLLRNVLDPWKPSGLEQLQVQQSCIVCRAAAPVCTGWGPAAHPIPALPQPPSLFPRREQNVWVVSLWLSSPCFIQEDVCFLQRKAQFDVTLEENKTDIREAKRVSFTILCRDFIRA